MVQIDATYDGDLRCKATHAESGTTLLTDAPKDNHGKGESFSPTDLVATAVGTCMLTTMAIAAKHHNIDFTHASVRVRKEMTSSPPRRIAKLTIEITGPLSGRPSNARFRRACIRRSKPASCFSGQHDGDRLSCTNCVAR